MTGATAIGGGCFHPVENNLVDGTLKEAVYQLSKNQSDLNDMFKSVIMDFQVRLLENQGIVIREIVSIGASISDIMEYLKMLSGTMLMIQRLLEKTAQNEEQPMPKTFQGWTVQRSKKDGFIRLYKSLAGKVKCLYVGRSWDETKALSKINGVMVGVHEAKD